jgi:hypothetical protein
MAYMRVLLLPRKAVARIEGRDELDARGVN